MGALADVCALQLRQEGNPLSVLMKINLTQPRQELEILFLYRGKMRVFKVPQAPSCHHLDAEFRCHSL